MVFVPLILITAQGLGTRLKVPASLLKDLPLDPQYYQYVNAGALAVLIYSLDYLSLDLFFGVISTPIMVYLNVKSTDYLDESGSHGLLIYWGIQIFSWLIQFVGHGVFEHRAPALLENLNQALLLAPLFVMFEIANLFGFRKDIMKEVDELVKPEVEQFRAERARIRT
jgi:2-hydroxy fatty acid dioxygenase